MVRLTYCQSAALIKHLKQTTYTNLVDLKSYVAETYGISCSDSEMKQWLQEHGFIDDSWETLSKKEAVMALAFQIASIFAHEINQSLTAILAYNRGSLRLINEPPIHDERHQKLSYSLEQIERQSVHVANIIHHMTDFMGGEYFSVEETDINDLVEEALSILDHELMNLKVKIILDLKKNLPKIMTNRIHIIQVILNLTRNSLSALQSTPNPDPKIIIETQEQQGHIMIHVVDNGPGVAPNIQQKILSEQVTTKREGAGIGLHLSRLLIEAHGGQLSMQQKEGAWFTFTLPVSQPMVLNDN